jgi:AcrR family transcriptional regulator
VDTIVRVTAETIDESGLDGVTIRGIAERAGCSPTIIYHYFENKDGLLHRAVQLGLDWFVASVKESDAGGAGVQRVRASSQAFVEWGIRNPSMYRLMFEQRMPRPAGPDELKRRRAGLAYQQDLLAEVLGEKGDRAIDPVAAADIVFASLHGVTSAAISGRLWGPRSSDEETLSRARRLVDRLVDVWAVAWGLAS